MVGVAPGYLSDVRLLAAWCELRQDLRHFCCGRMENMWHGAAYPLPHRLLLRFWRQ